MLRTALLTGTSVSPSHNKCPQKHKREVKHAIKPQAIIQQFRLGGGYRDAKINSG